MESPRALRRAASDRLKNVITAIKSNTLGRSRKGRAINGKADIGNPVLLPNEEVEEVCINTYIYTPLHVLYLLNLIRILIIFIRSIFFCFFFSL